MSESRAESSAPALPASWARLHPLSPLARGGGALFAAFVVGGPQQVAAGQVDTTRTIAEAAVAVVIILAGFVSWRVTRWRVTSGELQLDTGLFRRKSLRVPLVRLQAVDVVRPLLARILGLSELRLVLAGHGTGKARLAFLPHERALEVRFQLLAASSSTVTPQAEQVAEPLAFVPAPRLIASVLLGVPALLTLACLLGLLALAFVRPSALGPTVASVGPAVFGFGATSLRRLNLELGFTVAATSHGLLLRSGLLQTRVETIPDGRVQAVRLVQPVSWRPFGWCRLEVDVAQQSVREVGEQDSKKLTRALLPVGSRAQADALLARVLPGAGSRLPQGSAAPSRARGKALLSYRNLALWHDEVYVLARTGRLRVETVIVPLAKVQSVRLVEGPLQRRLRLATIHIDTAGRSWQAVGRDRDREAATGLLETIPSLARAARVAVGS